MLKILADDSLPLLDWFQLPFTVTRFSDLPTLHKALPTHDILLCRSTLKVNQSLLAHTPIQCVATASSGIDHIDTQYLKERQITLLDAKGSNAHAVADYVCSTLSWVLKHHDLKEKSAGVIGMGCVGQQVATRLNDYGFTVCQYDPLRAELDESFITDTRKALQACQVLCVHANLHDMPAFPTRSLINDAFLTKLAPKTVLINAARGSIVHEHALFKHDIIYCTDVYENEPNIAPAVVDYATLCTPHIAGHSIEAKKNAVIYLIKQLSIHFQQTLTPPVSTYPPREQTFNTNLSLEDNWLQHYSPWGETQALKKAQDKTQAFLTLRRAHHLRHDVQFGYSK